MHLLSSIAYRQQGIARFLWSRDRKTLSIDGFPVHIPSFMKNIQQMLADVSEKIKGLFRGCDYLDILEHIDQGMVPDESGQPRWFRDQIGSDRERYLFLEEDENGFAEFSDRLLVHFARNSKLFGWVDNKMVSNRSKSLLFIFFIPRSNAIKKLVLATGSRNLMTSSRDSSILLLQPGVAALEGQKWRSCYSRIILETCETSFLSTVSSRLSLSIPKLNPSLVQDELLQELQPTRSIALLFF